MKGSTMREPARREARYQDLLNAPPEMIAEILDGELVLHPRPAPPHADTCVSILADVSRLRRRKGGPPGGWQILLEPEIHLDHPREITVPDVAGWRFERLPRVPPKSTMLTVAPDWVCEILSPSTIRDDRTRKMRIYARNRVPSLWLVDPQNQILEVYQLGGEFYQQIGAYSGDERVSVPPFTELELDLSQWWTEGAADEESGAEGEE
jgi:Uma2 family endonuclease